MVMSPPATSDGRAADEPPVPTATGSPALGPALDLPARRGHLPSRRGRQPSRRHRRRGPFWLMIPGAVLMVVVIVLPFAFGLWFSLSDLDQYNLRHWIEAPFIAVANYVEALGGTDLLAATGRSVVFAVVTTLVSLPIGLLAALATQNRFRGRALVRSLFLVPYVLPGFVVANTWRTMFKPDGIVNHVLASIGVQGGDWLIGPKALLTLIIVDIWASWAFVYLMATSGLQTVTREVHEAAALDGASWRQKLRYVILPQLKGPVGLGCLISVLSHINNFTLPFVLFGQPAPHDIEVLPVLIYQESFISMRFGLAAAMSIIALVLVLIPLLFYLRAIRLDVGDDGGAK